ncbi:hypothetical protein TNCV_2611071 [Trichonephila clavipes]|nr:hypothetical protein TNCV_2611071 [Trichonephila clavipes]
MRREEERVVDLALVVKRGVRRERRAQKERLGASGAGIRLGDRRRFFQTEGETMNTGGVGELETISKRVFKPHLLVLGGLNAGRMAKREGSQALECLMATRVGPPGEGSEKTQLRTLTGQIKYLALTSHPVTCIRLFSRNHSHKYPVTEIKDVTHKKNPSSPNQSNH